MWWSVKGKKSHGRCSLPMNLENPCHMIIWQALLSKVWGMPSWQQSLLLLNNHAYHGRIHHSTRSNDGGLTQTTVPHQPAFWNGGMVQHELKSDLALRELEHVQVDSPGLAYLFFYERYGHHSLRKEAALAMCSHIADTFAEWIGRSAHFDVVPQLLEEGWPAHNGHSGETHAVHTTLGATNLAHSLRLGSVNSGSSQLVGRVPPVPEAQEGTAEQDNI